MLEDMFNERRRLEERRKKMELGYGEINVVYVVAQQLDTVHCLTAVRAPVTLQKL
jgi:hypothetical protein